MIEKLKKKINNQIGESLAETLVSLLIAALALVMLAGAMTAASSVITKSRDKLSGESGYYSQTEAMVTKESGRDGVMAISGTTLTQQVNIVYNANKAFNKIPVIAYKSK